MSRAAVVVNPTKLDDDEAFRKSVRRVMDDHGWDEPLWLETTPEDPGRGQAESAVSAGIGLVLACGGDGTVTACAEGITGTGIPLAIIPMGTGNLLARNIGLPMGLEEALAIALGGVQQPIDAGRVNGALFVVMAGLGLDAEMLSGTIEPELFADAPEADDAELLRHGVLPRPAKRQIFVAALEDVVFPGLVRFGVDAGPARAWLADRLAGVRMSK